MQGGRSITLNSTYANQYAAGGDKALIDYLRGPGEYRTGLWQGYREDLEAIVDLGQAQEINTISVGFLQDVKSWIWIPKDVEFAISSDGQNFEVLGTRGHDVPDDKYGGMTHDIGIEVGQNAQYVRIRARQYGVCPDWHLGAGGKTWIFADEIVVR